MRILGIDYGRKRIGLAISDPLGMTAQGLSTLLRNDIDQDIKELQELIKEKDVEEIVIGLPKNMNNTIGEKAEEVLKFIDTLKSHILVPIRTFDERLSTVMGNRVLKEGNLSGKKRKKKIDMVAAQFILQGYLNSIDSGLKRNETEL